MQRAALPLLSLAFAALASCQHEITVDYPTVDTKVVFDGQVSNEGVFMRISHSRPMADSTKNHFIGDAQVWIDSDDGSSEQLVYDEQQQSYVSPTGMTGSTGHTYTMRALVDGSHYEAKATMPPPAVVDTIYFRWVDILHHTRMIFVCVKGQEPLSGQRNYFLCRLMRGNELFRWNPRSGRSNSDGKFEYDVICATDGREESDVYDDGKKPLADGDTLRMELLTIDYYCWRYFQSMSAANTTNTNPVTNIRGGGLGVFMATNISRPDTLVFNKETILSYPSEKK